VVRRGNGRATASLIAVPDRRRRLSDGMVVEASIVARLFRFRLLAIDASLVVSPARVAARSPAVAPRARPRATGGGPATAEHQPAIAGGPAAAEHPRATGGGLAAAERFLDEGSAHLAASRRPRARR
jgi:hypothetical protein